MSYVKRKLEHSKRHSVKRNSNANAWTRTRSEHDLHDLHHDHEDHDHNMIMLITYS